MQVFKIFINKNMVNLKSIYMEIYQEKWNIN